MADDGTIVECRAKSCQPGGYIKVGSCCACVCVCGTDHGVHVSQRVCACVCVHAVFLLAMEAMHVRMANIEIDVWATRLRPAASI